MSTRTDRLEARLAAVEARIADIEAAYPTLAKYASTSKGFGELSVSFQRFGEIGGEYRRLMKLRDQYQDELDTLLGTTSGEHTATTVFL